MQGHGTGLQLPLSRNRGQPQLPLELNMTSLHTPTGSELSRDLQRSRRSLGCQRLESTQA